MREFPHLASEVTGAKPGFPHAENPSDSKFRHWRPKFMQTNQSGGNAQQVLSGAASAARAETLADLPYIRHDHGNRVRRTVLELAQTVLPISEEGFQNVTLNGRTRVVDGTMLKKFQLSETGELQADQKQKALKLEGKKKAGGEGTSSIRDKLQAGHGNQPLLRRIQATRK